MTAKKESQINLLPKSEFEASTFGRILKWLLSSFRIIVIVTELVVMAAFISRFWLDAKSADLNDEIRQKQSFIEAQQDFENIFRLTQNKIKIVKDIVAMQTFPLDQIHSIATNEPSEITLSGLTLGNDNSAQIRGSASSENSISSFIANLRNSGKFKEVSLDSLTSDIEGSGSLVFVISLTPQSITEEQAQ